MWETLFIEADHCKHVLHNYLCIGAFDRDGSGGDTAQVQQLIQQLAAE